MSERNGSQTLGTGTAEIPVVRPDAEPVPVPVPASPEAAPEPSGAADGDPGAGMQATAPLAVRPMRRMARRGRLTVMGPWARVAGGLLGLLVGVVAVLFLAGTADQF